MSGQACLSAPIKGWEDLKGKAVSVNKGTPYETLSKDMSQRIGMVFQSFNLYPHMTMLGHAALGRTG